jgi:NAD(P)-dependent dehydrogenase (short-subunit alcohol dehydrogenase family)
MKHISGKNVYISGGTSGIGLAIARLFASSGANLFRFFPGRRRPARRGAGRNQGRTARRHQQFDAVRLDVADRAAVLTALREAAATFGKPYVLVNSAGIGGAVYFEELTEERFDRTMKINLYGTRYTVEALLPFMKEGGGYIVNVSSMSGVMGLIGYTAYSSSKFAVVGFSEALRSELKPHGIWVSVVCPPQVDTPLLQETDKTKPPETKRLNDNAGLLTADAVALAVRRGLERKKFMIIPGARGRAFYLFNRYFPTSASGWPTASSGKSRRRKEKLTFSDHGSRRSQWPGDSSALTSNPSPR